MEPAQAPHPGGVAAPDYLEPVVGWRSWVVVEREGALRLRSVVFKTVWPPHAELTATCERPTRRLRLRVRRLEPHDAPLAACECGIYGSSDAEAAAGYFYLYSDLLRRAVRHRVIGTVYMWGAIVEAERGWRASCAYPREIYVPTREPRGRLVDAEEVAVGLADYGVPVHILGVRDGRGIAAALTEARGGRAAS